MQKLKKINLRGISEILNEKELKNVLGGSGTNNCSMYCGKNFHVLGCSGGECSYGDGWMRCDVPGNSYVNYC